MTSDFFRVVNEARRYSLGPFSPSFNIQTCLLEGLQKHLPDDAHKRVNGRLHISLTRVYDGKNVIISEFESREEVLQALLCACFIPGFSGILPPRNLSQKWCHCGIGSIYNCEIYAYIMDLFLLSIFKCNASFVSWV